MDFEPFDIIDDDGNPFAITAKGIQVLLDLAHVRMSIAEHEGDGEGASHEFLYMILCMMFCRSQGWTLDEGVVLEALEQ